MRNTLRLGLLGLLAIALTACGGNGGTGGIPGLGGLTQCDPGMATQLANPLPNQSGVSPSIGQITIVANGNNGSLYSNTAQWYLTLTSNFGDNPGGFALQLTPDPNGPHPYPSDFYYAANVGTLAAGRTWTVFLNEANANCSPVPLQSFST